jgi:choline kinase
MDKLKALGKQGGVNLDDLIDYDFAARVNKAVGKLKLVFMLYCTDA